MVKLCFMFPHWNNPVGSGMQALVWVGHQGHFDIIFKVPLRIFKGLCFVRAISHHLPAMEEPSQGLEAQCPSRAFLELLHFYCSLYAEVGKSWRELLFWRQISISVVKCTSHEMELLLW